MLVKKKLPLQIVEKKNVLFGRKDTWQKGYIDALEDFFYIQFAL